MNRPSRHHWLPQFFIRPWAGVDGLVTSFFRVRERVIAKRKSPKALGAEQNLYTLKWSGFEDAQFMETDLLANGLESPSARIRDALLEGGVDQLTTQERDIFGTFVTLLSLRRPDFIVQNKQNSEKEWKEFLVSGMKQKLDGAFVPMSQDQAIATYEEKFAGAGNDMILLAMVQVARSADFLGALLELRWKVFDLSDGEIAMVVADEPADIVMENGKVIFASLPLSPWHLFVAASDDFLERGLIFKDEFKQVLAVKICGQQCRKAKKFVIGTDKRAQKLVEQNLGKSNEWSSLYRHF